MTRWSARAEWSSSDVIANGVRLHVVRTGGDKRPLVLAHGGSGQTGNWLRVARPLEADYDLIMYDARGHGLSEAPPSMELEDLAADLASLVEVLHLEQPYLMGESLGALTVALAASAHPALPCAPVECTGLILLEMPHDLSFWRSEQWVEPFRGRRLQLKGMTRAEALADRRAKNPSLDEELLAVWTDGDLRFAVDHLRVRRGPNILMPDVVRAIPCPVLMLVGDADKGSVLNPEMEREFARCGSINGSGGHVQVVHVAGAGHAIHYTHVDTLVQRVRAFLRDPSTRLET